MDYELMYYGLFNAVTAAILQLDEPGRQECAQQKKALRMLIEAQCAAEEMYLSGASFKAGICCADKCSGCRQDLKP